MDVTNLNNNISTFCASATNTVLPIALSELTTGVSNGYKVGASELGTLNGYNNGVTHRAAFYGVEYSPDDPFDNSYKPKQLVWRTLGSKNHVTDEPAFTGNADQAMVDSANARYTEWLGQYEHYKHQVEVYESWGIPYSCWGFWPLCASYTQKWKAAKIKRDAYKKASDWLGDADQQWKAIMGHSTYTSTNQCYCGGGTTGSYDLISWLHTEQSCEDYVNNPSAGYEACDWIPMFQEVTNESDGIVIANSQAGFPGIGNAGRMEYANHFQERNCTATKKALLALFDEGGQDHDSFFITPKQ